MTALLRLVRCAAVACVLTASASPVAAFKIQIPDNLTSASEQEQLRWLNEQSEHSESERKRVATERYEQRRKAGESALTAVATQAWQRQKAIQQSRAAAKRDREESGRAQAIVWPIVLLAAAVVAYLLYRFCFEEVEIVERPWRRSTEPQVFDLDEKVVEVTPRRRSARKNPPPALAGRER